MDYDKTNIACHFVEYRIDLPSVKYNIQLGCLSFRCSLQISKKTQENSCTGVSFSINLSSDFCKTFKNTFFTEHLLVTNSAQRKLLRIYNVIITSSFT